MQSRVAAAASTAVRSAGIDPNADPPRVVPLSARDIASTSGVDEPPCSTLSRTRLHLRGSDDERDEL